MQNKTQVAGVIQLKLVQFMTKKKRIIMKLGIWGGGLLVGKELFAKYKHHLNPKNWFKKQSDHEESHPLK